MQDRDTVKVRVKHISLVYKYDNERVNTMIEEEYQDENSGHRMLDINCKHQDVRKYSVKVHYLTIQMDE